LFEEIPDIVSGLSLETNLRCS